MNIEDAAAVGCDEFRRKKAHEACKANKLDSIGGKHGQNILLMLGTSASATLNNSGFKS